MAVLDVVRSGELDRLRVCDAPGCDDVVVDLRKQFLFCVDREIGLEDEGRVDGRVRVMDIKLSNAALAVPD